MSFSEHPAPSIWNIEILGWWSHSVRSVRVPSWIRWVWHRFPWHYCRCWRTATRHSSANLGMGCRKETFTHAADISKQRWHFACKRGEKGNQVRTKTKLKGIVISRANTCEAAVNVLKGSPCTKITLRSLPLKEGKGMHNWGSDHTLQSEFRTGLAAVTGWTSDRTLPKRKSRRQR